MVKRFISLVLIFLLMLVSLAQDSVTTYTNQPVAIELSAPSELSTPLTYQLDTQPAHGTLTGEGASYIYQPEADFVGTDSFSYTVIGADGNFSSATMSIEVLAATATPLSPSDNQFNTRSADPVDFMMLVGENYQILEAPLGGTLSGQVPNVTYTPDVDFVGQDRFVYALEIDGEIQTVEVLFNVAENPELTPMTDDIPPAPESLPSGYRQNARSLRGLSPQVAALAQPGINNSLADYPVDLDEIVKGANVQVVIRAFDTDATSILVEANGGIVEAVMGDYVIATVPINKLIVLGADASIMNISLPAPAFPIDPEPQGLIFPPEGEAQTGNVQTQGVAYMNVDDWHNAGYRGQGVKIGVIDFGYQTFSTPETTCAVAPVRYDGTAGLGTNSVHGTAVVETVCDVAPNAIVYPVFITTEVNFVTAVNYLTNNIGVDIIVASLGFFTTPSDGETSISAQAVENAVTNRGVIFAVANGNMYRGHYESFYNGQVRSLPDGSGTYNNHNFGINNEWGATVFKSEYGGTQYFPVGHYIDYYLKWNDWDLIQNDLDLILWHWNSSTSKWEFVTAGDTDNFSNGLSYEEIHAVSAGGWYRVQIIGYTLNTPGNLWIELLEANRQFDIQYHYNYSSNTDPAAADEAFSVGAVYWGDSNIENYSSSGPANTLNGGAPLPNGYFHPQIAAPTRGSTYVYGGPFGGTSGAAPHAAGAAAVVWSAHPFWTNINVQNFLKNRAVDAGTSGADTRFGYGILYLGAPPVAGTDTVGIYRSSDRSWYLRNSNTGGNADFVLPYGDPSDKAVVGDWDGDGDDTVGIFRNGTFYLKNSISAGNADISFGFGASTDIPVAGDWNGDGIDTVGVYRPSTGTWFLTNSSTGANVDINFTYGLTNETPVAGDWNGDGIDTVGIFRASDRTWYLRNSNNGGAANILIPYGDPAQDVPVVGDWNGDGIDTVGVYRKAQGVWYLRNSNTAGNADLSFSYGLTNETPVVGDWDGQ